MCLANSDLSHLLHINTTHAKIIYICILNILLKTKKGCREQAVSIIWSSMNSYVAKYKYSRKADKNNV